MEGPGNFKHHRNSTKRRPESTQSAISGAKREKKNAKIWAPILLGSHHLALQNVCIPVVFAALSFVLLSLQLSVASFAAFADPFGAFFLCCCCLLLCCCCFLGRCPFEKPALTACDLPKCLCCFPTVCAAVASVCTTCCLCGFCYLCFFCCFFLLLLLLAVCCFCYCFWARRPLNSTLAALDLPKCLYCFCCFCVVFCQFFAVCCWLFLLCAVFPAACVVFAAAFVAAPSCCCYCLCAAGAAICGCCCCFSSLPLLLSVLLLMPFADPFGAFFPVSAVCCLLLLLRPLKKPTIAAFDLSKCQEQSYN